MRARAAARALSAYKTCVPCDNGCVGVCLPSTRSASVIGPGAAGRRIHDGAPPINSYWYGQSCRALSSAMAGGGRGEPWGDRGGILTRLAYLPRAPRRWVMIMRWVR